jgi:hypothetical protein
MKEILVPISPGELLDKITILRIKALRIVDAQKLANVHLQLELLEKIWQENGVLQEVSQADEQALQRVNERLWDIENRIRGKEAEQAFDAEFIELARAVYFWNDQRAVIKTRVNTQLGSRIVEEKSYTEFRSPGTTLTVPAKLCD